MARYTIGRFTFGPQSIRTPRYSRDFDPLLGTRVAITVDGRTQRDAQRAQSLIAGKMFSLEGLLNARAVPGDEATAAEPDEGVGRHVGHVLRASELWRQKSGGVFNSQVALLGERWRRAETENDPPTDAELQAIAAGIARPAETGDTVSLAGLGKGYIIDRALQALADHPQLRDDVRRVLIVFGRSGQGDVTHVGSDQLRVGIRDPRQPDDPGASISVVTLTGESLSRSGSVTPGRFIIDPRNGQPATGAVSVAVVADDAITADALATILTVLTPDEGVAFVGERASCLIVDADGRQYRNEAWRAREASPGVD